MQIVPTRSVLLAVTLSIGLPVLVVSPSIYFPTTGMELAYLAGRLFGLVAFLIISFQYLWTARIKLMERLRSYDRRVAVHRALGFLEILILCLNPILILGTYAIEGLPLSVTLPMGLRFLALLLLLLIAGSTFLSRIWRVRYETWKRLHWITFPVLTLAFLHSLALGSDMYGATRYIWFGIWGVHLAILLYRGSHGIRAWESWHPFSLTSNPSEEQVSMAIRAGDPVILDLGYVARGDRYVR